MKISCLPRWAKSEPSALKADDLRENVEAEVAPLELALAEVAPLGKGDRLAVVRAHRQRVAVHEVLRQHVGRGAIQLVRLIEIQIVGEDLQHVRAALGDVVRQQLDAVDAHQREQRVVPPLEVGLAELEFDGGELALQDRDEEVAAPARRLQEAGVDALGLALHEVEHRLDQPRRSEHLPVVGDAFLGFDQAHRAKVLAVSAQAEVKVGLPVSLRIFGLDKLLEPYPRTEQFRTRKPSSIPGKNTVTKFTVTRTAMRRFLMTSSQIFSNASHPAFRRGEYQISCDFRVRSMPAVHLDTMEANFRQKSTTASYMDPCSAPSRL